MAVDTRNKRASVLGLAVAFCLQPPAPDASLTAPDRLHLAYGYAGISAAAVVSLDPTLPRTLHRLQTVRTLSRLQTVRTLSRLQTVRTLEYTT